MNQETANLLLSTIPFKDLINDVLSPSAKLAGEALSSAFSIALYPVIAYAQKNKIKYDKDIEIYGRAWEDYAIKISQNINLIPQNKLIVPNPHEIIPIIDQSKYYISEESYRLRFSQLIAASFNKDNKSKVKPIHSHVLSNMSETDAHIFNFICNNLPYEGFEFVIPRTIFDTGYFSNEENSLSQLKVINTKSVLFEEIKLEKNIIDIDMYDYTTISESIDTLVTLGLFTAEQRFIPGLMDASKCTEIIKDRFSFYYHSEVYSKYISVFSEKNVSVSCTPHVLVLTTLGESFATLTTNIKFLNIDNLHSSTTL